MTIHLYVPTYVITILLVLVVIWAILVWLRIALAVVFFAMRWWAGERPGLRAMWDGEKHL